MLRFRNSYGSSWARYASSSIIPSCAKKYGGSNGARRAPSFKYPRPGTRCSTIRRFGMSYMSFCEIRTWIERRRHQAATPPRAAAATLASARRGRGPKPGPPTPGPSSPAVGRRFRLRCRRAPRPDTRTPRSCRWHRRRHASRRDAPGRSCPSHVRPAGSTAGGPACRLLATGSPPLPPHRYSNCCRTCSSRRSTARGSSRREEP